MAFAIWKQKVLVLRWVRAKGMSQVEEKSLVIGEQPSKGRIYQETAVMEGTGETTL